MKISTVPGTHIAGVNGVSFSPTRTILHVAHAVHDVIIKGSGARKITFLPRHDFAGYLPKIAVYRRQKLRRKVHLPINDFMSIRSLFLSLYMKEDIDDPPL